MHSESGLQVLVCLCVRLPEQEALGSNLMEYGSPLISAF